MHDAVAVALEHRSDVVGRLEPLATLGSVGEHRTLAQDLMLDLFASFAWCWTGAGVHGPMVAARADRPDEVLVRSTGMKSRMSVAALVLWAMVLISCGGAYSQDDANAGASAGAYASSASPAPSSSSGGRYDYGSGGGGYGSGDTGSRSSGKADVTAEASNFEFSPSTIEVSRGDVLAIENAEPSTEHTFTVTGEGIDMVLGPDSSSTLTIDLAAGSYPFECRFHAASGMTGTLVVS